PGTTRPSRAGVRTRLRGAVVSPPVPPGRGSLAARSARPGGGVTGRDGILRRSATAPSPDGICGGLRPRRPGRDPCGGSRCAVPGRDLAATRDRGPPRPATDPQEVVTPGCAGSWVRGVVGLAWGWVVGPQGGGTLARRPVVGSRGGRGPWPGLRR